jgi:hypothetical protein
VRQAGFDALWQQALGDYDADVGNDWGWLSIDGAMVKVGLRSFEWKPGGLKPGRMQVFCLSVM